jgi:hypothetical protein
MAAPERPALDLGRLIGALERHGVEYLLCGGAAATAYGAERLTEDADCVVSRERANWIAWLRPCGVSTPVSASRA